MIDAVIGMLPGIIVLAAVVLYQALRERRCNRAFRDEREKWKERES